jgi:hypothetical protein
MICGRGLALGFYLLGRNIPFNLSDHLSEPHLESLRAAVLTFVLQARHVFLVVTVIEMPFDERQTTEINVGLT